MKNKIDNSTYNEIRQLCNRVRAMVEEGSYEECKNEICEAMERYPHAPEPHNLMGIVMEKTGEHNLAMKHFRAAWALDSTYLPARYNLDTYGTFFSYGKCAFDESDLPQISASSCNVTYDERGIGHITRRDSSGSDVGFSA